MAMLCHRQFPHISPQLFQETYLDYRIHHYGQVHMREILAQIAVHANLPENEHAFLVNEWMGTLPYESYVFHGARELLAGLGPERVFLLTKSPDIVFQQEKIAGCNLPILRDDQHIWIRAVKNQDVFDEWVHMMHEQGVTHLVYGSDEAREVLLAHSAATRVGLGFDGVHHQYGSIWQTRIQDAHVVLGDHYHPARNFHQFAKVMRGLQRSLEGSRQTIEWGKGGVERM